MWVKFGMEEGPLVPSSMPNFTPIGATHRGEKPQNRPLSKLNTSGVAACNAAGKNVANDISHINQTHQ